LREMCLAGSYPASVRRESQRFRVPRLHAELKSLNVSAGRDSRQAHNRCGKERFLREMCWLDLIPPVFGGRVNGFGFPACTPGRGA